MRSSAPSSILTFVAATHFRSAFKKEKDPLTHYSITSEAILTLIMPLMLIRIFVFLAFNTIAFARVPAWTLGNVDDWVSSGVYLIYSCSSKAPIVQNLLDLTYRWTRTANLSMESPAYEAFFGNTNQGYVRYVLGCITSGCTVNGSRPTLVCVNEADAGIRTFWNQCHDSPKATIILPSDSTNLMLCPRFFGYSIGPQHENCGIVNHANTKLITQDIDRTQYGYLIDALAYLYIPIAMATIPLHGTVVEENACMNLAPDVAVRNPSNYAFFTSSKLSLSVCLLPSMMKRSG